jgi:hypothetical protein
MNRPTHRQVLWIGLTLIAVVNAIALGGAAWNRSLVESRLTLGERELRPPYVWEDRSEDSGVALGLQWRVGGRSRGDVDSVAGMPGFHDPDWLTPAKLHALGFDRDPPPVDAGRASHRSRSRRVLLVLELAGPAHARAIADREARLHRAESRARALPADADLAQAAENARRSLSEERQTASRLFVVDAGLDPEALRARYPDRARYAIARGTVTLGWSRGQDRSWTSNASVGELAIPRLHLSRSQVDALGPAGRPRTHDALVGPPFTAVVAFGRRFEPWVESLRR